MLFMVSLRGDSFEFLTYCQASMVHGGGVGVCKVWGLGLLGFRFQRHAVTLIVMV